MRARLVEWWATLWQWAPPPFVEHVYTPLYARRWLNIGRR